MTTDIDFQPASHAVQLADELTSGGEAKELQREILQEAKESGSESGRTVCGTTANVKKPLKSGFTFTILPGCRLDHRGLVHGGGGHDLRAPTNSVLDMSNVIFGGASVSMVVGTRRSDLFLAPTEDQLDDVQLVLQNALGVEVDSVQEYIEARDAGRIRNPVAAASKIRQELDPLFRSVDTPHPEIESESATAAVAAHLQTSASKALRMPSQRAGNTIADVVTIFRELFDFDLESISINLPARIFAEMIDAVVLLLFLRVLGGRPTQLVRNSTA